MCKVAGAGGGRRDIIYIHDSDDKDDDAYGSTHISKDSERPIWSRGVLA